MRRRAEIIQEEIVIILESLVSQRRISGRQRMLIFAWAFGVLSNTIAIPLHSRRTRMALR